MDADTRIAQGPHNRGRIWKGLQKITTYYPEDIYPTLGGCGNHLWRSQPLEPRKLEAPNLFESLLLTLIKAWTAADFCSSLNPRVSSDRHKASLFAPYPTAH